MGLDISYHLSLPEASVDQVRAKVTSLHALALTLSFERVDDWVELQGETCYFDMWDLEDPYVYLKLRGLKPIEVALNGCSWENSTYLMGFDTLPGQGSETAAFGLATHTPLEPVNDWSWHGFCKTQYASNPAYGGLEQFIGCHLRVIQLLDAAQSLGIQCQVQDDGQYWETRDITTLTQAVRGQNVLMAAANGWLKDAIAPLTSATLQAPILEYPNFEHLEAEGSSEVEALDS